MGRRTALAGGVVCALALLAALAVTLPDASEGIWIDYAVPLAAIALALVVALADDPPVVGLLARLIVGGVWFYAGFLKIGDPAASVEAVRAYELLPGSLVPTVGYLLPPLEMVLGLALIAGLLTRGAALLTGLLTLAFIVGISSAWARGLNIDCGCFGDGGAKADAELAYPWELARDVALLVLSAYLVRARAWLALDSLLFRPITVEVSDIEEPQDIEDPEEEEEETHA